jgi:hypothetical protein
MDEPVNREAGDDADKADHDKGQAPAQPEILRKDGHDPGKAGFAFGFHATIFNHNGNTGRIMVLPSIAINHNQTRKIRLSAFELPSKCGSLTSWTSI